MRRASSRRIVRSAAGYVVEALERRTLLSFQANVNFQDQLASLPEGSLRDVGWTYQNQIGGGTYGWDANNAANARNRDSVLSPDQRHDTLNHMQMGGTNRSWSISVPNDTYRVRIVAGDGDAFDSVYKIAAEGVLVVDGTPDTNNRWVTGTQEVTVTDGKLTITNAAGAVNNKICFIEIVDASRLTSVPAAPTNLKAMAESATTVNLTWTDNADNDTAYKVERSPNGTTGWVLFDRFSDATFFGNLNGMSANTTWHYRVRAANPAGMSAYSDVVSVTTLATNAQVPYNATSTPWSVGSVIEAENYDRGGETVASHDTDTTNSGGQYRVGYVDIIRYRDFAQVGTFVGFNQAGEWLEYTINVPHTAWRRASPTATRATARFTCR